MYDQFELVTLREWSSLGQVPRQQKAPEFQLSEMSPKLKRPHLDVRNEIAETPESSSISHRMNKLSALVLLMTEMTTKTMMLTISLLLR